MRVFRASRTLCDARDNYATTICERFGSTIRRSRGRKREKNSHARNIIPARSKLRRCYLLYVHIFIYQILKMAQLLSWWNALQLCRGLYSFGMRCCNRRGPRHAIGEDGECSHWLRFCQIAITDQSFGHPDLKCQTSPTCLSAAYPPAPQQYTNRDHLTFADVLHHCSTLLVTPGRVCRVLHSNHFQTFGTIHYYACLPPDACWAGQRAVTRRVGRRGDGPASARRPWGHRLSSRNAVHVAGRTTHVVLVKDLTIHVDRVPFRALPVRMTN